MKTFVLCILTMLLAIPAWGQWEYGGKQIGYGPIGAIGLQPRLCPDNSGGVYVVWTAYRDDRPGREIVLCHFDTSGAELFGTDGLLITNDSLDQSMPAISPDGFGGCYVVWTDHRDFPDRQYGSLYAQRITYDGEMLWGQGVRMLYTPGYAPDDYPLRGTDLCSDTSFGMIAVCKLDTGYEKAVLISQRLDENGNRLWDSLGVIIHSDSGVYGSNFNQPHLVKSQNNFYCAWRDVSEIKLQKFDKEGSIYFGQGGINLVNGNGNPWDDRGVQMISDGYGGVVIGWIYDTLTLGTTIKADRISSSGQSLWQANGKKLLPYESSQRWGLGLFKTGLDNNPTFWAIMLGGYQANYQKLNLAGNLLLGNSGGIFTQGTYFASAEYADTFYFMQELDTLYYNYFGSKRDTNTIEHWPNPPYINNAIDGNYEIMADRLGGMYVTFVTYRDFLTDWVYIQRIYPNGHFGGETTAVSESGPVLLPQKSLNLTNYPNPFNESTLISFDINTPTYAKLKIFDSLGRVVDSVNFGQLGIGRHSCLWDIKRKKASIASGIYFILLDIGTQTETGRIIVLK